MQQSSGGYWMLETPLVRESLQLHTPVSWIPDAVLRPLNRLQQTGWLINQAVLDVAARAHADDIPLSCLPQMWDLPRPQRIPDADWDVMDPQARKAHKNQLTAVYDENASMVGHREAFLSKLAVAEEFRDKTIWFPHSLDFRLRVYPIPSMLSPQADDLSKGFLQFSEGVELGPSGLYYLGVRMANAFGQDKLSFEERFQWCVSNEHLILDSARSPLEGERFWTSAEEPWQALASCLEWAEAVGETNPERFVSHLPIPMDGACNGMQHLSLMGRDSVGALATNCSRTSQRHDLYAQVAAAVERLVALDCREGVPEALAWQGRVDRKTVKRAVMTTPYGVTRRGIQMQLMADGHTKGVVGLPNAVAGYLERQISKAMEQTCSSARNLMSWFQSVAEVTALADEPLDWITPVGARCRQAYRALVKKQFVTVFGRQVLLRGVDEAPIMKTKQLNASAPNIIHSFDASMLDMTVDAAWDEGVRSFSLVHDSYGTHAANTPMLAVMLRRVARDIYTTAWPAKLHEFWEVTYPKLEIPTPPKMGDFDVNEVLDAPYFFS